VKRQRNRQRCNFLSGAIAESKDFQRVKVSFLVETHQAAAEDPIHRGPSTPLTLRSGSDVRRQSAVPPSTLLSKMRVSSYSVKALLFSYN